MYVSHTMNIMAHMIYNIGCHCSHIPVSMKLSALILVSLLQTVVDCQGCDGNLVGALTKCASSIKAGDTLSVQQDNCTPEDCNYAANAINDLSQQLQDVSATVQQLMTKVNSNTGDISTIKDDQTNTNGTIQNILMVQDTLWKTIANNSADIDLLIEHIEHPCGSAGWTRIAYLDMSDTDQQCPPEFMEYSANEKRACGRQSSNRPSCDAISFVPNISYIEVCGKVLGYQKGTPQAIHNKGSGTGHNNLDSFYVDGISITIDIYLWYYLWVTTTTHMDIHGF